MFLLFEIFVGPLLHAEKIWVVVVAYSILVSAPSYWNLVGVGPRGFWD